MKAPAQLVQEFVLAQLDAAPLSHRATLYRSLAALAATPNERNELCALAAETTQLNARHQRLLSNFKYQADVAIDR